MAREPVCVAERGHRARGAGAPEEPAGSLQKLSTHAHGYAMASCMRNRTIALFTTRHLAEVPADLGRGIEGAQASTEQQPIVRLSSILGPCDNCIE